MNVNVSLDYHYKELDKKSEEIEKLTLKIAGLQAKLNVFLDFHDENVHKIDDYNQLEKRIDVVKSENERLRKEWDKERFVVKGQKEIINNLRADVNKLKDANERLAGTLAHISSCKEALTNQFNNYCEENKRLRELKTELNCEIEQLKSKISVDLNECLHGNYAHLKTKYVNLKDNHNKLKDRYDDLYEQMMNNDKSCDENLKKMEISLERYKHAVIAQEQTIDNLKETVELTNKNLLCIREKYKYLKDTVDKFLNIKEI